MTLIIYHAAEYVLVRVDEIWHVHLSTLFE